MTNMIKKRFSALRVMMVALLAMILTLSMATPAFATGEPIYGTESDPAVAAITKLLKMPIGTTTPDAEFNFEFKKKSVNDSTDALDMAKMPLPVVAPLKIRDGRVMESGGVKSVYLETPSLFGGITWPHAGAFVYEVKEEQDNYIPVQGPGGLPDKMTYSPALYEVSVYVKEKASPGEYYVYAIAVKIIIADESNGSGVGKVNPTPGDPNVEGSYSGFIFTNHYLKDNGGTNPITNSVLAVGKTVSGSYGDKTKYFQFSVEVTKPATVIDLPGAPSTYKAYIVEKDAGGNPVVATNIDSNVADIAPANLGTDAEGKYIIFTTGQAQTVYLKHDQQLSFVNLQVGSGFKVNESAVVGYTPHIVLTAVGATNLDIPGAISTAHGTGDRYVGDFKSSAAFRNTAEDLTPTGISVSNLPFIILIIIVAGGLAAYVAIRRRATNAK